VRGRKALGGLMCTLVLAAPASAGVLGPLTGDIVGATGPPPEPLVFGVPMRGPLESPFGYRWGRLHAGIDIGVLRTDAVHAAVPGIVVAVGWLVHYEGYGIVVKLRTAGGIITLYAHLARALVHPGQWVEEGQLIGRAGCTGSCTGPHLHFEVHVRGKLANPMRFLHGRVHP
jgi:murein DD-endopeptidase MepM/ murein hydrolase activator NlpD